MVFSVQPLVSPVRHVAGERRARHSGGRHPDNEPYLTTRVNKGTLSTYQGAVVIPPSGATLDGPHLGTYLVPLTQRPVGDLTTHRSVNGRDRETEGQCLIPTRVFSYLVYNLDQGRSRLQTITVTVPFFLPFSVQLYVDYRPRTSYPFFPTPQFSLV